MAIIPQKGLWSWEEIESLGDLERLLLVLEVLPDERLMRTLERERGHGRNDYPLRAVWNSLLAGIVFEHPSVESLRRELRRNKQLRWICGFDLFPGEDAVPPSWVYTRFLRKLLRHGDLIEAMFDDLVEGLRAELPGFGRHLAGDGKALETHARPRGKDAAEGELEEDGRRDRSPGPDRREDDRRRRPGVPGQDIQLVRERKNIAGK